MDIKRAWAAYNKEPNKHISELLPDLLNDNKEVRIFDKSVWKELRNIKVLLEEINKKI